MALHGQMYARLARQIRNPLVFGPEGGGLCRTPHFCSSLELDSDRHILGKVIVCTEVKLSIRIRMSTGKVVGLLFRAARLSQPLSGTNGQAEVESLA